MTVNMPKLIAPRQVGVDRGEHVEVFRADEEFDRRVAGRLRLDLVRHQLARRILRVRRRRNRDRMIGDLARAGGQRGRHEVVVVDAGVPEVALVRRLLREVLRREPLRPCRSAKSSAFGLLARSGCSRRCRQPRVPRRIGRASARDRRSVTVALQRRRCTPTGRSETP